MFVNINDGFSRSRWNVYWCIKRKYIFNRTYKELRKYLIENYNVCDIISIPQDQFENTSIKTSIIIFKNQIINK